MQFCILLSEVDAWRGQKKSHEIYAVKDILSSVTSFYSCDFHNTLL